MNLLDQYFPPQVPAYFGQELPSIQWDVALSAVTSRLPQAESRSYWNRTEVRCILVGVHVASLFMAYHCLCGLRLLFSCPECQTGFLTPGAFCSLAAVWVVVPESLPAHWTTHLASLLSFLASLVPVGPLVPPCSPSSTISVCPHSGRSAWWRVYELLLIWGLWAWPWTSAFWASLLEPGWPLTPPLTLSAWLLALSCPSCSSIASVTEFGLSPPKPQVLRWDCRKIFVAEPFPGNWILPAYWLSPENNFRLHLHGHLKPRVMPREECRGTPALDSAHGEVQHAPELPAACAEKRAGCSVVESSVMMILLESCPAPKCVPEVSRWSSTFLTSFPLPPISSQL